MAVRLVCRACGKRLKLPDGLMHPRKAKCPKCRTSIDLTAALEASAYELESTGNLRPLASEPSGGGSLPPAKTPLARTQPPPLPQTGASPLERGNLPQVPPATPTGASRPPLAKSEAPLSLDDEPPLSLDDDPVPAGAPPVEPVPFRVPVRVLADSLRQFAGPCSAVLLPHGLFLEHEPMRPFLYVPLGCPATAPADGELTLTLPDGRAITLRFEGRRARELAADTRAFLAGERPVPAPAEYRRKWWLLGPAVIFALGLATGPVVLSQHAELGLEFGLAVGGAFALVGLFANAAVVLFSRRSVPAQVAVMAGVCVLVGGVFLFGATAYLAGRQKATEEQPGVNTPGSPNPGAPNPPPTPPPPQPPPEPPPARPPSHIDKAYQNGVSALEDGPAEVTALALAPDGNTLGIGYADGTTRLWPLDQPTFDVMLPGPKCDGPVTRIQFDSGSRFVFAHCATGVVAAPRNGPPAVPAKIPGTVIAVSPEPNGDRIRFAAVRGNNVLHRFLPEAFVQTPPPKAKVYAISGKGEEITPAGVTADPVKPAGPTFLAWLPAGKLVAGQPDGAVTVWGPTMKPEPPIREHKAAVRAWAECAESGDFATGDDQGNIGWWAFKAAKPLMYGVFAAPVTGLAFCPTGEWLAATDSTGWVAIWDVGTGKVIHRVKRPTAVKALAAGPYDDLLILASGKTVEVWWLPGFVK